MTEEKKLLPIVSCTVEGDGLLQVGEGMSLRIVDGDSIAFYQLHLTVDRVCTDENGRPYRVIPLWMVPFHWMRGLFRRLPGGGKWLWDYYPDMFETETIDSLIQSFKLDYTPEE